MSRFIMLEADNKNDPIIGKFEKPIKMIIEEESNKWEKDRQITKYLYNIENSNQFAETIMGETGFDDFEAVGEGNGAPNDTVGLTTPKTIYHHEFKKEFTITEKLMEDAKWGFPAEAGRRARDFTRAWYNTQNKIAEKALYAGTTASFQIGSETVDLKTADGQNLFSTGHTFTSSKKNKGATGTQSNYFKAVGTSNAPITTAAHFKSAIEQVVLKMSAFKDENGEPMGYTPDTIILPSDSKLRFLVQEAVGSELVPDSSNNNINTQYGLWNVVILPHWLLNGGDAAFMVMSSEANEALRGNMFYNRAPLRIKNWIDNHTGNYIWGGRGRYGLGFGTWKHIAYVGNNTANSSATALTL